LKTKVEEGTGELVPDAANWTAFVELLDPVVELLSLVPTIHWLTIGTSVKVPSALIIGTSVRL
jgi:hypothetical protein